MNISETNGKEMLEKYNNLTKEEQLNFWSGLLLILSLGKKTTEEGGE